MTATTMRRRYRLLMPDNPKVLNPFQRSMSLGAKLILGLLVTINLCIGLLFYHNWTAQIIIKSKYDELMAIQDDLQAALRAKIFEMEKKYLDIPKRFTLDPSSRILDWIHDRFAVIRQDVIQKEADFPADYSRTERRDLKLGRFVVKEINHYVLFAYGRNPGDGHPEGGIIQLILTADDPKTAVSQIHQQMLILKDMEYSREELTSTIARLRSDLADEGIDAEADRIRILYKVEEIQMKKRELVQLKQELHQRLLFIGFSAGIINALVLFVLTRLMVELPLQRLTSVIEEIRKGGSPAIPFLDRSDQIGMLSGALKEFNDAVIELKASKKRYKKAKQDAESANLAKSRFLANMSHEIRTPMNGVLGMLGLLRDTPLDQQQKDYIKTAEKSANLLLGVIHDILDVSKIEAGRLELEILDFNMRDLIEESAEIMNIHAAEKNIKLSAHIEPRIPLLLQGDPGRIKQVIINLLSNAIKFTPEGSVSLFVDLEKEDKNSVQIKISVKDDGPGIPPDRKDKLFKPFSQIDASTTRQHGGTGLGLSISKQLVELMGGPIDVHSGDGKGATFWFSISLQKQAQQRQQSSPGLDGIQNSRGPALNNNDISRSGLKEDRRNPARLLVVEDNPVNQKVALLTLKKLGFHADVADNGQKAVAAIRLIPYDLVFMDLQMPEMDGLTATKTIRSAQGIPHRGLPIVALTANALNGDRERCLAAGMNDYLSKPLQPEKLKAILEKWVRG